MPGATGLSSGETQDSLQDVGFTLLWSALWQGAVFFFIGASWWFPETWSRLKEDYQVVQVSRAGEKEKELLAQQRSDGMRSTTSTTTSTASQPNYWLVNGKYQKKKDNSFVQYENDQGARTSNCHKIHWCENSERWLLKSPDGHILYRGTEKKNINEPEYEFGEPDKERKKHDNPVLVEWTRYETKWDVADDLEEGTMERQTSGSVLSAGDDYGEQHRHAKSTISSVHSAKKKLAEEDNIRVTEYPVTKLLNCMPMLQEHPRGRDDEEVLDNAAVRIYLSFLAMYRNLFIVLSIVSIFCVLPIWGFRPFFIVGPEDGDNNREQNFAFIVSITQNVEMSGLQTLCSTTILTSLIACLYALKFQKDCHRREKEQEWDRKCGWLSEIPVKDQATLQPHTVTLNVLSKTVEKDLKEAINDKLEKKEDAEAQYKGSTSCPMGLWTCPCVCCTCQLACNFVFTCCPWWKNPAPAIANAATASRSLASTVNSEEALNEEGRKGSPSSKSLPPTPAHTQASAQPIFGRQVSGPSDLQSSRKKEDADHVEDIVVQPVMTQYAEHIKHYLRIKKFEERVKAFEWKTDQSKYECLKQSLQICIQNGNVTEGEKIEEQLRLLAKVKKPRPGDESLKSDSARLKLLAKEGLEDITTTATTTTRATEEAPFSRKGERAWYFNKEEDGQLLPYECIINGMDYSTDELSVYVEGLKDREKKRKVPQALFGTHLKEQMKPKFAWRAPWTWCKHFRYRWFDRKWRLAEKQSKDERDRFKEIVRERDPETVKLELSGHAFVVFKHEGDLDSMLQPRREWYEARDYAHFQFGRPPFSSVTLQCRHAPHPTDIYWDNLHTPFCPNYFFHIVKLFLLIVITIGVVIAISFFSNIDEILSIATSMRSGGWAKRLLEVSAKYKEMSVFQNLPTMMLLSFNSLVVPLLIDQIATWRHYWLRSWGEMLQLNLNFIVLILSKIVFPFIAFTFIGYYQLNGCNEQNTSEIICSTYKEWSSHPNPLKRFGYIFVPPVNVMGRSGNFYLTYALNCCFLSNAITLTQLGRHLYRKAGLLWTAVTKSEKKSYNECFVWPWGYWYAWSLTIAANGLIFGIVVPSMLPVTALNFALKHMVDRELFKEGAFNPGPSSMGIYAPRVVHLMLCIVASKVIAMGGAMIFLRFSCQEGDTSALAETSICAHADTALVWGIVLVVLAVALLFVSQMSKAQQSLEEGFKSQASSTIVVEIGERVLGCIEWIFSTGFERQAAAQGRAQPALQQPLLGAGDHQVCRICSKPLERAEENQELPDNHQHQHLSWDAREHCLQTLMEKETDKELRDQMCKLLGKKWDEQSRKVENIIVNETERQKKIVKNTETLDALTQHLKRQESTGTVSSEIVLEQAGGVRSACGSPQAKEDRIPLRRSMTDPAPPEVDELRIAKGFEEKPARRRSSEIMEGKSFPLSAADEIWQGPKRMSRRLSLPVSRRASFADPELDHAGDTSAGAAAVPQEAPTEAASGHDAVTRETTAEKAESVSSLESVPTRDSSRRYVEEASEEAAEAPAPVPPAEARAEEPAASEVAAQEVSADEAAGPAQIERASSPTRPANEAADQVETAEVEAPTTEVSVVDAPTDKTSAPLVAGTGATSAEATGTQSPAVEVPAAESPAVEATADEASAESAAGTRQATRVSSAGTGSTTAKATATESPAAEATADEASATAAAETGQAARELPAAEASDESAAMQEASAVEATTVEASVELAAETEQAAAELPAAVATSVEAPAVEETTAETPTAEAPAVQAPAAAAASAEAPAAEEESEEVPFAAARTIAEPAAEPPSAEEPAAEAPSEEAPVVGAPAAEAPAVEAPAVEAADVEAPAVEAAAVEAAAVEEPAAEASVESAARTGAPPVEATATEAAAGEATTAEASAESGAKTEASAGEATIVEAPAESQLPLQTEILQAAGQLVQTLTGSRDSALLSSWNDAGLCPPGEVRPATRYETPPQEGPIMKRAEFGRAEQSAPGDMRNRVTVPEVFLASGSERKSAPPRDRNISAQTAVPSKQKKNSPQSSRSSKEHSSPLNSINEESTTMNDEALCAAAPSSGIGVVEGGDREKMNQFGSSSSQGTSDSGSRSSQSTPDSRKSTPGKKKKNRKANSSS